MAKFFISHSKRDAEAIAAFCNVFARTPNVAILEEFENYVIPPWTKIRDDVQQSAALFLLLSPHLNQTPYTQNWVSYEVGLACALRKPVWVYEQMQNPVLFPVPYLTDYVVYDPRNREHLAAIKQHVDSYDSSPAFVGLVLGALIGAAISGGVGAGVGATVGAGALTALQPKTGASVQCPFQNCGIQFRIYSPFQQLRCPACRQVFQLNWPVAPPT